MCKECNFKLVIILIFSSHTSGGPTVDPTMKLFLQTPKQAVSSLSFTLTFTVSNGVPTRLHCVDKNNINLFNPTHSRGPFVSHLSREVIRSHYINSSYPDMTRVSIARTGQSRAPATYTCTVYVEGRVNPENRNTYNFRQMGNGVSTVNITGKCINCTQLHCSSLDTILYSFSSQLQALPLVSWPPGQVSTVLMSPGLPHHQHQLSMKCFIR